MGRPRVLALSAASDHRSVKDSIANQVPTSAGRAEGRCVYGERHAGLPTSNPLPSNASLAVAFGASMTQSPGVRDPHIARVTDSHQDSKCENSSRVTPRRLGGKKQLPAAGKAGRHAKRQRTPATAHLPRAAGAFRAPWRSSPTRYRTIRAVLGGGGLPRISRVPSLSSARYAERLWRVGHPEYSPPSSSPAAKRPRSLKPQA